MGKTETKKAVREITGCKQRLFTRWLADTIFPHPSSCWQLFSSYNRLPLQICVTISWIEYLEAALPIHTPLEDTFLFLSPSSHFKTLRPLWTRPHFGSSADPTTILTLSSLSTKLLFKINQPCLLKRPQAKVLQDGRLRWTSKWVKSISLDDISLIILILALARSHRY